MSADLLSQAELAFAVVAWTMLAIFFVSTMFWVIEIVLIGRARWSPIEHEPPEIEVRILTIDAEPVVQGTVDALPADFAAVRVIAEQPITIEGASVHVVPEDFTCEATRKGRAIEWARRTIPCTGSYVLYLDEDTLLKDFRGLPDADIVQLSEQPIRSDSWLTYFAEIFRMGFQLEQRTFPKFRYPLYAWGGGIAVRKTVEDEVTWNSETLTEDTNFVWRAFANQPCEMEYLRVRAMNQAPPSIKEMIHQRRRWISGAARDSHLLPRRYQVLSLLRNAAWALVCLSPLLALPLVTPIGMVLWPEAYQIVLVVQLVGLFGWALLGHWYYGERARILAALLLTVPIVAFLHAVGALWAIVQPATDFRVTEKVKPPNIDDQKIQEVDLEVSPDGAEQDSTTAGPEPEQHAEPEPTPEAERT